MLSVKVFCLRVSDAWLLTCGSSDVGQALNILAIKGPNCLRMTNLVTPELGHVKKRNERYRGRGAVKKQSSAFLWFEAAWHEFIFFFNDTATTEIYTLSLHDLFRSLQTQRLDPGPRDAAGAQHSREC